MRYGDIAFFGDSFTWGEGLELYSTDQKWITQRNTKSTWLEIQPIQDEESILFRESNRFPKLVTTHFKSNLLIDHQNGGSFRSLIVKLNPILNDLDKPEILIYQFSSFNRNDLCFEEDSSNFNCKCNICEVSAKYDASWPITFDVIYKIISDMYYGNLSEYQQHLKTQFSIKYNIDFDLPIDKLIDSVKTIEIAKSKIHLEYLFDTYFKKLESDGVNVFFIDTWDNLARETLIENEYFVERVIPLVGYDDNSYVNYSEWESTFEHRRIIDEFPKTENAHPTLLQHQYIGKSIIDFLEKKNIKNKIKYI